MQHERYRKLIEKGGLIDPTEPPPAEEAWVSNQKEMIETIFIATLRESLFISLYAFLELRLIEECRYRERWGKTEVPLKDVIRGGIDKAKDCLKGQVDFSGREWQEIKNYQRLRDFFVHCGSFENVKSEDHKRLLREYANREPTLSLGSNGIGLQKGFCEKVLDTVEEFLRLL